jgi:hypothetical protein
MSLDPALAETGQAYAYASDDPVNEGDPSGMLPEGCGIGGSIQYLEAHCRGSSPTLSSESPACTTLGPKTPFPYQWAECAYDALSGDGLSAIVDAAVDGNLQYESGDFEYWDATACYGGTCGFGIAQWTVGSSRYENLMTYTHNNPTFAGQINFIDNELTTTYGFVLSAVDHAVTGANSISAALYDATMIVMEEYEVPTGVVYNNGTYSILPGSIAAQSLPRRYADAVSIYNSFGGGHLSAELETNLTASVTIQCP